MRGVIVVDVETSGLDPGVHEVVEVAWWWLDRGAQDVFIPPHTLQRFDRNALVVNGYFERHLYDQSRWDDGTRLREFHAVLDRNWIVGCNPGFDWAFLRALFTRNGLSLAALSYPPLDVCTYAAGKLGRPITDRVGLAQLCRILGVTPGNHSAMEDVRAVRECLIKLGL